MRPFKIAITCGDNDGIGLEVVSKALTKIKPNKKVRFYLWRSHKCPDLMLRRIDRLYKRITVKTWPEALAVKATSAKEIIDIASPLSPAKWVHCCAQACFNGYLDGIATAPLSKSSILTAGINAIGHTEILAKQSDHKNLFMTFIGEKFNVLLSTGHIPLKDISKKLTYDLLLTSIRAAHNVTQNLPKKIQERPIGLLGLNPHSGEQGIIGSEELTVFKKILVQSKKEGIVVDGPIVPDAAFLKQNWKKYSIYVCPYHDQGLIPFKLVHGQDSGVHITSGLPFIRTSVDHGTAKDIFGKNMANPSSMIEAIIWAVKLCEQNLNVRN